MLSPCLSTAGFGGDGAVIEVGLIDAFQNLLSPGDDLVAPTRSAVLGTLLSEPLVLGLLRTANAMRSIRRSEGLPLPRPHLGDLE